jgi:D-beta-D-heptose 7-phosphate kinase/D-beta-D-heptose 1-phosphate adenosyltransferase
MLATVELLVKAASNLRIAVIGDVMLDENLSGAVPRISPEAPVMVMLNEKRTVLPGGAANVVAGIVALGCHCTVIGLVGDDSAADELAELLVKTNNGLCQTMFVKDKTRPTTVKTRFWGTGHGSPHQLFRVDSESSKEAQGIARDHLLANVMSLRKRPAAEGYDAIVVSDYAKGTVSETIVKAALSTGIKVIVAPKPSNGRLFKGVHVIVPNSIEATTIAKEFGAVGTDMDNIARTLQTSLMGDHLPSIVITLGKEGILTLDENGLIHRQPTVAKEVFDVTGAGDTVLAVLSTCIAAGIPLKDAASAANMAAGIKVKKMGVATVTLDEMKDSLRD